MLQLGDMLRQKIEIPELESLINEFKKGNDPCISEVVKQIEFGMEFDEFNLSFAKSLCKLGHIALNTQYKQKSSDFIGKDNLIFLYELAKYGILEIESEEIKKNRVNAMFSHFHGHKARFAEGISHNEDSKVIAWQRIAAKMYLKAANLSPTAEYKVIMLSNAGTTYHYMYRITGNKKYKNMAKSFFKKSLNLHAEENLTSNSMNKLTTRVEVKLMDLQSKNKYKKTTKKVHPYSKKIRYAQINH